MEGNRRSRRCGDFFCIVITVFAAVLLTLITYYNAKMTAVFVDWEVIWYIADRPWLHALLFLLLVLFYNLMNSFLPFLLPFLLAF